MDIIGFLYHWVAAQSIFLVVEIAGAHVQRLVSVVRMATVLEECNTEDQRSVMRFLLRKSTECRGCS
jgi:hypothetical protein